MAAERHEISLRVLKNISRVSPPFELFYDEFKVTKRCTKIFLRVLHLLSLSLNARYFERIYLR